MQVGDGDFSKKLVKKYFGLGLVKMHVKLYVFPCLLQFSKIKYTISRSYI